MIERMLPKIRWACWLLAAVTAAAVAQTTPPVSDASLERLATAESRLPQRLSYLVYDNAKLRAEIKRIGFEKGCRAVNDSRREVSDAFVPKLVPATVASIRRVVPAEQLNSMRVLSFFVGSLQIYKGRVDADLDATAGPILRLAYDAMRRSFVARTKINPTERNRAANVVVPKADISAAIGIKGAYNLDNPGQLGLACAELTISPSLRPKISTMPQPPPFGVVPQK